jgi:hypothetical protein
MRILLTMLAVLMAGGTMLVPSVASADSYDIQKAERRRLRDKANKLMQRNAWSGVEKTFQEMRRLKKVAICWQDYLAGAQAAMNLGKPDLVIARLWGAKATMKKLPKSCDTKKNETTEQETTTWLKATMGEYAYVKIKAKKGVTVSWQDAPFNPSLRQAGDAAINVLNKKRKYRGLMPVAEYKTSSGQTFTVKTVKPTGWLKALKCVSKMSKKKRLQPPRRLDCLDGERLTTARFVFSDRHEPSVLSLLIQNVNGSISSLAQ